MRILCEASLKTRFSKNKNQTNDKNKNNNKGYIKP